MTRRYDIDWLRIIAIFLLIIYHTAIVFQPWAVSIAFSQSALSLEVLWIPMMLLNVWRIPLLFFVSGMALCFSMKNKKRTLLKQLLGRAERLLVPYVFGWFTIVPLQSLFVQAYYQVDLSYTPHPSHLWFLNNVHVYGLLLIPLVFLLAKRPPVRLLEALRRMLVKAPLSIYLFALPLVMEGVFKFLVLPELDYASYFDSLHGWLLGGTAFFLGFLFISLGEPLRQALKRMKLPCLCIAALLYVLRLTIFDFESPDPLVSLESSSWIFALLGFADMLLNRPSRLLSYLGPAVFPVYIVHMLALFAGAYLILPLKIGPWLQYILILLFTIGASFLFYELIRRILIPRLDFLRPLFGLARRDTKSR